MQDKEATRAFCPWIPKSLSRSSQHPRKTDSLTNTPPGAVNSGAIETFEEGKLCPRFIRNGIFENADSVNEEEKSWKNLASPVKYPENE